MPNVGGASAAVSALPIGFIVESGNSISFISSKESSSLDAFMTIASVALNKLDLFFNLNNNNKIQQTNKIKEEKSQNNKTKKVKKEV